MSDANLLRSSISESDIKELKKVLKRPDACGIINDPQDCLGRTVLHLAAESQNVDILRYLLKKVDRALVNRRSANGQTPLCFGLTTKPTCEEFFLVLLSHPECDVNLADKRKLTPLHYAIHHGEIRIAQKLLDLGANVDATSTRGSTPLYLGVQSCNYELVCMLMYYNADVNVECKPNHRISSPILHAIEKGYHDITMLLLDYIADIDKEYSDGQSIFYHAISNGSQVVSVLAANGANINQIYNDNHYIMGVRNICDNGSRIMLFDRLWPLVDIAFMMDCCQFNLYELCFSCHLLPMNFFASLFVDYDRFYARRLAKHILLYDTVLTRQLMENQTEDMLLKIFYSMFALCDTVSNQLIVAVYDNFGVGELFWSLINVNVKLTAHNSYLEYYRTVYFRNFHNTFLYDFPLESTYSFATWRRYFSFSTFDYCEHGGNAFKFPSLVELARNKVRHLCRRQKDRTRPFTFIQRIKKLQLSGTYEDILCLRKPIYV